MSQSPMPARVPDTAAPGPGSGRRPATADEAKALGHPLRLRILRMCREQELTNRQLADRLGRDPGTVLFHVRQLTKAGLLEQAPVRSGASGALEKPYRALGHTWWLEGPVHPPGSAGAFAPIQAFQEELLAAGPQSVATFERISLHLSPSDVTELDRRIFAVLDDFVRTDDERADQPPHGALFVVHRLAD